MLVSWFIALVQGLIAPNRFPLRRRAAALRSSLNSVASVESLETRQMLSANPVPTRISEILIVPPPAVLFDPAPVSTEQFVEISGTPNAITFDSHPYWDGPTEWLAR